MSTAVKSFDIRAKLYPKRSRQTVKHGSKQRLWQLCGTSALTQKFRGGCSVLGQSGSSYWLREKAVLNLGLLSKRCELPDWPRLEQQRLIDGQKSRARLRLICQSPIGPMEFLWLLLPTAYDAARRQSIGLDSNR